MTEIQIESGNTIIGELDITEADKEIRIINSFESFKKEIGEGMTIKKEDYYLYENENEIKNCEIKINDKTTPFAYFYKFDKPGKYTIEYSFKGNLTNLSFLFCQCKNLIRIDFSKFNSKNITSMYCLFCFCVNLTNVNFSNFNTEKVTDMSWIFMNCYSLANLDLSSFNTQNVTTMEGMFQNCKK